MSMRMNKVNELLLQKLSKLLQEEFSEEYGVISVTYVNTAADLKTARVGISIFQKNKENKLIERLKQESETLRRNIGSQITLKNMPKLEFQLDQGVDETIKINQLLDKIEKEDKKISE